MREKTIFEKIIDKELPANVLYEDDRVIAIYDINPKTEGHFLVIPKKHSRNLKDIDEQDFQYAISKARELALEEIKKLGVDGFRLIINNEASSKQVVFHTHIHIIPSPKE